MKIQSSFWTQVGRAVAQYVSHDGSVLAHVSRLLDRVVRSQRSEQHLAAAELFTLLGGLPNSASLGFLIGRKIPVTAHGELSLGLKVAPTFGDVLRFAAKFHHLLVPLIDYSYSETRSEGRFVIGFRCPIDKRGEAVVVATAISMLEKELVLCAGREGRIKKLELTSSSKGLEAIYHKHVLVVPETSHGINTVVIDRAVLDLPNPLADLDTFNSVVSTCIARAELRESDTSPSARVRELIITNISNPPSLDGLSKMLNVSPRQLRIALAKENTSYQEVVRTCRIECASVLFRNPALSVSQIAYRLGYSDLSAFTHSFSRWTGKSPSTFRIEMLSRPASI